MDKIHFEEKGQFLIICNYGLIWDAFIKNWAFYSPLHRTGSVRLEQLMSYHKYVEFILLTAAISVLNLPIFITKI